MLFRQAQINDLPLLLQMEQKLMNAERAYDADIKAEKCHYYDFDQLLQDDQAQVLVMEVDNNVVGMGYVQLRVSKPAHQHHRYGYMGAMYVAPKHRGEGRISQLIEQLVAWSKEQGVSNFYLDVYHDNLSAVKAYNKLGFQPCLLEMKLNL
ncbi:MAG: GNAT family N-acetyltransferase [Gammaproteobacteria bacterium]|nr:GNAT family N-acetyltransferase [Gammaproteobacteria bacterium]MCP4879661.1 GNAT family N-acetyltransferase [Gammaproteobacteria bacterium]